ncbi:MAG: 3-oxo-tetronate kinase [Hyphomicrobiaceae bacterium]
MPILLGCIADDFTGATDLANTLVKEGMRAVQLIGVPDGGLDLGNANAVVIALRSRTAPTEEAVGNSLKALSWLQSLGALQFYFKVCSTFDSTAEGNIGPVADALLNALDTNFAIVCPAFPQNGRTVYQGHLFVGDQLLSESPMKDHPLTPMRNANLIRLMSAQSSRRVGLIDLAIVVRGNSAIAERCDTLQAEGISYGIADAVCDDNLRTIGHVAAQHKLIIGGSGVAIGLPASFSENGMLAEVEASRLPTAPGRSVVIAGSCSKATRGQIARAKTAWPAFKVDIDRIAAVGPAVVDDALGWAHDHATDIPVLVYGSADPDEVARNQEKYGRERTGQMMEEALGRVAQGLVERGTRRLIVAGGETSGAVVSALGIRGLRIGPEIDPGVPWTETLDQPHLALALKSGNFGSPDFFSKALEMLP